MLNIGSRLPVVFGDILVGDVTVYIEVYICIHILLVAYVCCLICIRVIVGSFMFTLCISNQL